MGDRTFLWQLYIATYTAALGIPLLFFPRAVIPWMGFDPSLADTAPFVRLTGMFLLCLTLVTFRIWQKRLEQMVLGTVIIRIFIILTLAVVGATGGFPFLFIMIGVVAIGVIGTLWSLRTVGILRYL